MPMPADLAGIIIGADTHNDTHTAALTGRPGAHLATIPVSADTTGCTRLISFAASHKHLQSADPHAPEDLRAQFRGQSTAQQIRAARTLHPTASPSANSTCTGRCTSSPPRSATPAPTWPPA